MLTTEQKYAFAKANDACCVVYYGRNQYKVSYPWRDIDGPKTETVASFSYLHALQTRADLVVWEAMRLLGYETETCHWVRDINKGIGGRAIDRFKRALDWAGPVDAEGVAL